MTTARQRINRCAGIALAGVLVFAAAACDGTVSAGGGDGDGGAPRADAAEPELPELCNEIDDDADGRVDEGCSCTLGTTQACWPGDPSARGVGECRDGVQHCQGEVEFSQWSPCEGAVLPSDDPDGDGIDQSCDGGDGDHCQRTGDEICDDGIDNDCDGGTDCRDPDCVDAPQCGGCTPAGDEVCDDGVDNDCDGLVDCDDVDDCFDAPAACTCVKQCPTGTTRWCDDPTYCRWGTQTCNPDGTWGACIETPARPAGCESHVYYDPVCCVMAGECCQALPSDDSVGDCPPGEIVCVGA